MKKLLLGGLLFFSFVIPTYAGNNDTQLTYNNLKDYYYEISGSGIYMSNYTTMFYANGKLAYCIEPGVSITTSTYNSSNLWSNTSFSKEQTNYMELIGYFGYEYPGHNTVKYYLAAQELIWEYIRNLNVKFTTEKNGAGTEINLQNEKNTILNLIENYKKNPKFIEDVYSINIENTITDENNVLMDYEIESSDIEAQIKNNTLVFKSETAGVKSITLNHKKYDNQTTLIYTQGSSQALATLRLTHNKNYQIDLTFTSGQIEIQKYGEELVTNDNDYSFEMKSLPNVDFGLFDLGNNLIKEVVTDSDGKVTFDDINFGKYYIMELKNNTSHKIDDKKYFFNVDKLSLNHQLNVNNFLPKGKLLITKKDNNGFLIDNVKFGLYDEKDNLLCIKETKNGIIKIDNLPFGMYYLRELETPKDYIKDSEKHFFEIKSEEQINIELINDLIIEIPKTGKTNIFYFLFSGLLKIINNVF